MYNSCISRDLTSIYTDFNLLIELQYELEWILYVYSCSISLRNSLGKFFIQNQASSDGAYYQFWWSATYCPNHLVDYRPDLMLMHLSFLAAKLECMHVSKNASLFWAIMKCSFSNILFLLEIPSDLRRWCKCEKMYVINCLLNQKQLVVPEWVCL